MTTPIPIDGVEPDPLLSAAEEQCLNAATDLHKVISDIRSGKLDDVKTASVMLRELRGAFHLAMTERTRVEKHRKAEAGIVHDYALDFDSARIEISRRLARLRDAGRD